MTRNEDAQFGSNFSSAKNPTSLGVLANVREPRGYNLTQQTLPAFRPVLTPKWVISILFAIGIIFMPIGVICLVASRSVVQVSKRYDDICLGSLPADATDTEREEVFRQRSSDNRSCSVELIVPRKMKAPIFFYYALDNYYQSHRRYVQSRSDPQLRGGATLPAAKCSPEQYETSGTERPVNPCGLVAWSYFNDTYAVFRQLGIGASMPIRLAIREDGIAWTSDRKTKFGTQNATNFNELADFRGGGTIFGPVNEDEHFLVWMRTAALPSFRKLWGRIDYDIPKGSRLTVQIANRYNTYRFGGRKQCSAQRLGSEAGMTFWVSHI